MKAELNRGKPPRLSEKIKARLDRLSDEELNVAALSDPDNPPLTERELDRLRTARAVKRARRRED